ncbi:MAG: lipopolysaccharide biosynthesis protein [bacterium]
MSLKQKTINGLFWSFIDSTANQGIQFIFGIILARLLSPREFGLIGMLTVFIAISQSFIDSGFGNALIRKQNCTNSDYSTVFYFNLFISFVVYLILFFCADFISVFFQEPELALLLRVLSIGLIFNAIGIIQSTILTKNIDFKKQTRISIISSLLSGTVSIIMALNGFGVWSLVALTLCRFGFNSLFLWVWATWKPSLIFSKTSFTEMFSFGSKLLVSGLINTVFENVYYLIIGKYFSSVQLGYYTRADQFKMLPSIGITGVISRVSYPVLSSVQNDILLLNAGYKKLIKTTMFITFLLMIGMAAVAKPMIIVLIGEKWIVAAEYLQLLCFVGMFYPLHALNLNMLQVQGRSDLFLKLEIIKKILAVPTILIGVFFGIKPMIIAMIINTIIAYYLNSYWSGKFINYSFGGQVKDLLPSFLISSTIGVAVFFVGYFLQASQLIILLLQISLGAFLTFVLCELFKLSEYVYIKEIVFEKIFLRNHE